MITTLSFVETLNTVAGAKTLDLVKTYKACQTALELELPGKSAASETRLSMSLIEDALLDRGQAHLLGRCAGCGTRLTQQSASAYCTDRCEAIDTAETVARDSSRELLAGSFSGA